MLMAYFGHLFQTLGEILFNYLGTLQGRSLPEWSTLQFLTLRAPANIRPDRKGCKSTNALDYFGATTLRMTTLSLTAESQQNTIDPLFRHPKCRYAACRHTECRGVVHFVVASATARKKTFLRRQIDDRKSRTTLAEFFRKLLN